MSRGIIYEYEDGGTYCGEWERDSSHGYGVGTGPGGRGRFEGLWERGDQVSGVYTWPSGMKYSGSWKTNRRDGLGKETRGDGTEYCGEFVRGARGPYGVTRLPNGVYKGSWRNGKQDGEGEETYLDGGCYRGQYKNGVRSGFGTRTSAAYEHRDKDATRLQFDQSSKQRGLSLANPFANFKRPSYLPNLSGSDDRSEGGGACDASNTIHNMQIYEGEWKEDKRHGYGVIKCLGSYTYYGQWSANARTGYGVLISEGGSKEEGQWQNGQLMVALKRRKLHLKSHQLESKVQTAHTQAIQAAGGARDKALLAESRAATSMLKAKMAHGVVATAEKNAKLAREKAEHYKNATRISEVGLKSPMTDMEMSFSPIPPSIGRSRSSSHTESGRSDDSPSLGKRLEVEAFPHVPSYESLRYIPHDPSSDEDEEGYYPENSSFDSVAEIRRKKFSLRDRTNSKGSNASSHSIADDDDVQMKREEFASKGGSVSQQVIRTHSPGVRRRASEGTKERERRKGVYTGHGSVSASLPLMHEEEEDEEEGNTGGIVMDVPKRSRIDHSTGEMVKNSVSDEDSPDSPTPEATPPKSRPKSKPPLLQRPSVAMDILVNNLNQMANWNKMIAYVNFFLLLFLMILIIIIVIGMNYYQILTYYHNHAPEDQSSVYLPSSQIA